MSLKFVPPKAIARYALFVNSPKPTFKAYDDLGSAKNAWHAKENRYDAKILENVEGEWYVLFNLPAGTKQGPWVKEVTRYNYYGRNDGTYKKAIPMTRDEYAEWRLQVERERTSF